MTVRGAKTQPNGVSIPRQARIVGSVSLTTPAFTTCHSRPCATRAAPLDQPLSARGCPSRTEEPERRQPGHHRSSVSDEAFALPRIEVQT